MLFKKNLECFNSKSHSESNWQTLQPRLLSKRNLTRHRVQLHNLIRWIQHPFMAFSLSANSICEEASAGFKSLHLELEASLEQSQTNGLSLKNQNERLSWSSQTENQNNTWAELRQKYVSLIERPIQSDQSWPSVSQRKCQNESVGTNFNKRPISGTNPPSWLKADWLTGSVHVNPSLKLPHLATVKMTQSSRTGTVTHKRIQDGAEGHANWGCAIYHFSMQQHAHMQVTLQDAHKSSQSKWTQTHHDETFSCLIKKDFNKKSLFLWSQSVVT